MVDRDTMGMNKPEDPLIQHLEENPDNLHGTCVASVAGGAKFGGEFTYASYRKLRIKDIALLISFHEHKREEILSQGASANIDGNHSGKAGNSRACEI